MGAHMQNRTSNVRGLGMADTLLELLEAIG